MRTFAVARAVHGLEPLLAQEIERLGSVVGVRHREVWFRPQGDPLTLRLADDVLVAEAVVEGVGRERTALARLSAAARGLGGPGSHGVTASFVGRRNY
ncbi:MAG: RNA methyltransferase, partial [Nonomuraea sp.]|nr:RNA methyltransferase [Nonomuraea sp.]